MSVGATSTNTLADEFLADLGDEDSNIEKDNESFDIAEDFGDKEESKDDDIEILPTVKEAKDLIQILGSKKLEDLQKRIADSLAAPVKTEKRSLQEEIDAYQLVVDSNAMVLDTTQEIAKLHKYVKDRYNKKFAELESLVVNPLDYARVVQRIGNQVDVSQVNLSDILPSATIMVVQVTSTTSAASPLPNDIMEQVLEGCKYMLALDDQRKKIVEFVESRMNIMAPNLSAMVGTAIAAKLITAAGGLSNLSKLPSNNMLSLGAKKANISGSGLSTASIKTRAGFIYDSDVVMNTPPSMRAKAVRLLCGKCTLAARVDACGEDSAGNIGKGFREQVEKRLEKLQEPPPMKLPKPLPAPDDKPKKHRGGQRNRKIKQRYEMTDLRKAANRLAFGTDAQDSIMGGDTEVGLGMIGASGSGVVRLTAQDKGILKKQKLNNGGAKFGSSGATSGLSSSLAFTPIQGLELSNPQLAAQKSKESDDKYFGVGTFKKPLLPVKK